MTSAAVTSFSVTVEEAQLVNLASDIIDRNAPIFDDDYKHSPYAASSSSVVHPSHASTNPFAYVMIGKINNTSSSDGEEEEGSAAKNNNNNFTVIDFVPVRLTPPPRPRDDADARMEKKKKEKEKKTALKSISDDNSNEEKAVQTSASSCCDHHHHDDDDDGSDCDSDDEDAIENHLAEVATFLRQCLVPGHQRICGVVSAPPMAVMGLPNASTITATKGTTASNAEAQQKEEEARKEQAKINIKTAILTSELLRALQREEDVHTLLSVNDEKENKTKKAHASNNSNNRLVLLQAALSYPAALAAASAEGAKKTISVNASLPPTTVTIVSPSSEGFVLVTTEADAVSPVPVHVTVTSSSGGGGASSSPSSSPTPHHRQQLIRFCCMPETWVGALLAAPSSSSSSSIDAASSFDGPSIWKVGQATYIDAAASDDAPAAVVELPPIFGGAATNSKAMTIVPVEPLGFGQSTVLPPSSSETAATPSPSSSSGGGAALLLPVGTLVYIPIAVSASSSSSPSSNDEKRNNKEGNKSSGGLEAGSDLSAFGGGVNNNKTSSSTLSAVFTMTVAEINAIVAAVAKSASVYGTHIDAVDANGKKSSLPPSSSVLLHQTPRIVCAGVSAAALFWNGLGVLGEYEDEGDFGAESAKVQPKKKEHLRRDGITDETLRQLVDTIIFPRMAPTAEDDAAAELSKKKKAQNKEHPMKVMADERRDSCADFNFYGSAYAVQYPDPSLFADADAAAKKRKKMQVVQSACCGPPIDPNVKPFSARTFNLIALIIFILAIVGSGLILSSPVPTE